MPGVTEESGYEEEMGLFAITDLDTVDPDDVNYMRNRQNNEDTLGKEEKHIQWKPAMTLKQRRHSQLSGVSKISLLNNLVLDNSKPLPFSPETPSPKMNWLKAFSKIKTMNDPWAKHRIDKQKKENAVRHRYNALTKKWIKDTITVRVEDQVSEYIP